MGQLQRRILAALVAAIVVAVAGFALGGDEPQLVLIEVPVGTAERMAAGEDLELMPADLELAVGDTLEIRNHDVTDHEVGPYLVASNQRLVQTFTRPAVIEGICTLNPSGQVTITVS